MKTEHFYACRRVYLLYTKHKLKQVDIAHLERIKIETVRMRLARFKRYLEEIQGLKDGTAPWYCMFQETRTRNCLRNIGLEGVEDLLQELRVHKFSRIVQQPNVGKKTVADIKNTLFRHGLWPEHL